MEQKQKLIIGGSAVIVLAVILFFIFRSDLSGSIVIPYVAHQQPVIDPHLPTHDPLSDQLEDIFFDGLFNVKATPSGVVYEDGLAELVSAVNGRVTLRLKDNVLWHDSYKRWVDDQEIFIEAQEKQLFTAADVAFTIDRIRRLGTLSPDFILLQQAFETYAFTEGNNNEITFQFSTSRREWRDDDIKEIFSFKILPKTASIQASEFSSGTGPFLQIPTDDTRLPYRKNPSKQSVLASIDLFPTIDNSTFTSELLSNNVNVVLNTPFGANSPLLEEDKDYFSKSKLSDTFFSILFNTKRVPVEKRRAYRSQISSAEIQNRMYKVGSEQQRHIVDFLGKKDQYSEYENFSVFPSTSIYVKDQIIRRDRKDQDKQAVQDSLRIVVNLNVGFREELTEIANAINALKIKGVSVVAVDNQTIIDGNYDAILMPISGYRSNYLFDLYTVFLRQPDAEKYQINLRTQTNSAGEKVLDPSVVVSDKNFFRASAAEDNKIGLLYESIYFFMDTKYQTDKTVYAERIHEQEQELALGIWLFSLPNTSYFSKQFDPRSIVMFGHASPLSTLPEWKERVED
jgi:hypothetical protein